MRALGSIFQNMRIGSKIICLLILSLVLASCISVFILDKLRTVDQAYTKMIDRDPVARATVLRANGDMMNIARISWRVFALENEDEKKSDFKLFEDVSGRLAALLKRAHGLIGDQNLNKVELDKITAHANKLMELTPRIFKAHAEGNVASARQIAAEFGRIRADASAEIFALVETLDKRIQSNSAATTAIVNASVQESTVAIALVFVLSIALGYWISRASIANPLGKLTEEMGKLAKGDFSLEVSGTHRGDEIGAVAKTADVFKQSGLDRVRLEAETAAAREAAESERRANERRAAEAAAIQAEVVEALGLGLEAVSQGDLTARIDQAFPPEYIKLQTDFNGAVERLKDAMASVVQNVDTIRSGSAEIAEASDDLSKRTEQQAASLEQTAAALDQVTAMVKRTAEGSREASATVTAAREDAQASGAIVQDAILAMGEIEKSSVQISNIIGVIDEIAFQTNLLALNAGVEAARAGDAGRGFAVVAQEVRALAQRSAEAAKEIKALISASGEQVERGVSLVGNTGASLQRIVQQVSSIAKLVTEITAAAQEQATGLSEINTAVNSMDQMVQQNAAMVEQSTAACQSLNGQSGELHTLVSRFKVGERGSGGPRRMQNAVHASQARIANFAKPAARKPTAGPVSMDATARKLDEWQEF